MKVQILLEFLPSPLNYTGSKYRLLSQLLPHFPSVNVCYDLFCGGGSVSLNVGYDKVIANDVITPLIRFYRLSGQKTSMATANCSVSVERA